MLVDTPIQRDPQNRLRAGTRARTPHAGVFMSFTWELSGGGGGGGGGGG